MTTRRAALKEGRRADLLRSAAALFAQRGFAGVSTTELGDAVGMTGPALYNYFPSKDALLSALLVDASERLLAGGRRIHSEEDVADVALFNLRRFVITIRAFVFDDQHATIPHAHQKIRIKPMARGRQ